MPSNFRQLPKVLSSFVEESVEEVQDTIGRAMTAMGITAPTEEVEESTTLFNSIVLAGTSTVSFAAKKLFTHLHGINHRLDMSAPIEITTDAVFSNMRFFTTGEPETANIHIRGLLGPQVIFNGCTFVRNLNHGKRPFIEIEDGAEVVFVGCSFIGLSGDLERESGYGMVDTLNDSAADVQFIGCSRNHRNGYLTTHSSDGGGTKTGCI